MKVIINIQNQLVIIVIWNVDGLRIIWKHYASPPQWVKGSQIKWDILTNNSQCSLQTSYKNKWVGSGKTNYRKIPVLSLHKRSEYHLSHQLASWVWPTKNTKHCKLQITCTKERHKIWEWSLSYLHAIFILIFYQMTQNF